MDVGPGIPHFGCPMPIAGYERGGCSLLRVSLVFVNLLPQDHPRGAETALDGVSSYESLLKRMKRSGGVQPFYGKDFPALCMVKRHAAGAGHRPIKRYRASAAGAIFHPSLGAGEAQIAPEHPQEGVSRVHQKLVVLPVDPQGQGKSGRFLVHASPFPPLVSNPSPPRYTLSYGPELVMDRAIRRLIKGQVAIREQRIC